MATTRNQDGSWSYTGPVLADPIAQAAVEQAERDAILGNETTITQAVDAALAGNTQQANAADAWVAANPGALSLAVLSNQVRALTTAAGTAARQRNGVIRLLRRKLDATS